jgi:hypothetical protein
MTLSQRLSEFKFNLETMDLLVSMGRNSQQTLDEMIPLGFTSTQINFMQSSRPLLNSVLLRLQLYSEQNLSDAKVRSSLGVLNNVNINNLLDTLFLNSTTGVAKQSVPVPKQSATISNSSVELEEDEDTPKNESSRFDQFFTACVKKTNEPTDIVKTGDFYNAFTEWWNGIYEESVPDKNELKDFLNNKLGKSNKNTWSNVSLC